MDELMRTHVCDYCGSFVGPVQLIAIGSPGTLEVVEVWLHRDCEAAYIRMTFPNENE